MKLVSFFLLLMNCAAMAQDDVEVEVAFDKAPVEMVHSSASSTVGGTPCSGTSYNQGYTLRVKYDCILEEFPYFNEEMAGDEYRSIELVKGDTLVIHIHGHEGTNILDCYSGNPDQSNAELTDEKSAVRIRRNGSTVTMNIAYSGALSSQEGGRFVVLHRGLNAFRYPLPAFDEVNRYYAP